MQKMGDSLEGNLYLSANIMNVAFEANRNIIIFTQDGNAMEQTADCGETIIAFPQTSNAMSTFIPASDEALGLSELFEQVETSKHYFTLLLDDSESYFADRSFLAYSVPETAVPDNPARCLLFFKQQDFPGSSIVAYYFSPSEKTDEQAVDEALASYSALIGRTVDASIVQDFNRWEDYFPHVSTGSLNAGFYENVDALQGKFNQYYVGALFSFDMVQESMDHAKYIVERFL